jgi:hypothetical protein
VDFPACSIKISLHFIFVGSQRLLLFTPLSWKSSAGSTHSPTSVPAPAFSLTQPYKCNPPELHYCSLHPPCHNSHPEPSPIPITTGMDRRNTDAGISEVLEAAIFSLAIPRGSTAECYEFLSFQMDDGDCDCRCFRRLYLFYLVRETDGEKGWNQPRDRLMFQCWTKGRYYQHDLQFGQIFREIPKERMGIEQLTDEVMVPIVPDVRGAYHGGNASPRRH